MTLHLPRTGAHLRAFAITALLALGLAGCANRAPKPPPDPIRPLQKIALLPTLNPEALYRGRGGPNGTGVVAVQPMSPSAALATVGVGLIALAIINSREKEANQLATAVAAIGFDPGARLDDRLKKRLEEEGLSVELVDATTARSVRETSDYKLLAAQAEAVLDIKLGEIGYYEVGASTGYSPMLGMSASLATTTTNNEPESWSFYADWRSREKDTRWLQTPSTMNRLNPADIGGNTAKSRTDLETTLDRIIERLVVDVKRRAAAQPPL
jgi:hypothetical protein